jgi:SPP1 gp7 family putative phage head morphogenesis protein
MTVMDNMRLWDMAARNQLLVESVKAGMNNRLFAVLTQLRKEMTQLLNATPYQTLDGLTKAKITVLRQALRDLQKRAFSHYTSEAMEMLRDFSDASLTVNRRVWAYAKLHLEADEADQPPPEEPPSDKTALAILLGLGAAKVATDGARAWAMVNNSVIPAFGLYILPLIEGVGVSAMAKTDAAVQKAWSNKQTVSELIQELTANTPQGQSSVWKNAATASKTVINTAVQHVATNIMQAVVSQFFGRYRWDSVIDSRTSDICRSRNQTTYVFGAGPLPPAHPNCRSHIFPLISENGFHRPQLLDWLRSLPEDLRLAVLGKDGNADLANDTLNADNLPPLAFAPMSFDEYKQKVVQLIR